MVEFTPALAATGVFAWVSVIFRRRGALSADIVDPEVAVSRFLRAFVISRKTIWRKQRFDGNGLIVQECEGPIFSYLLLEISLKLILI